jgi:outer membrane protein assembly factor BamA
MVSRYFILIAMISFLFGGQPMIGISQESTKEEKKARRKAKKQEKIDKGKLMIMPLAGPAYTPEMEFTLAGGIMISFKTNPKDSLIQRSSAPVMLGVSSTGAYFFGTKFTSFWKQDKLRIYADLNFKNMPDNYWGVGYQEGYTTEKGDSTTAYTRTWWQVYPKFLWQFKKHLLIGLLVDFNYTKGSEASPEVREDPFYREFNDKPFNSGLGVVFQYDSRDVPVNAWKGTFIETSFGLYGGYLGGDNTYQVLNIDLRKYWTIKRKGSTIAAQLRGRFCNGDVPYGEMSQPGTPFDLRGYTWGRYRDESMVYAIGEYRHMFKKKDETLCRHGLVGWIGVGTLGETVGQFGEWLPSIGIGYRLEVQPRMNLRVDIGFGKETRGFYFNFNEAF